MTIRHRGRSRRRGAPVLIALAAGLTLSAGCAINERAPADLLPTQGATEASAPLGGEALVQRKLEMQRTHGDMVNFDRTLESLYYRRDKNGLVLFSQFLDAYLGTHIDPLLAGEWQSRHPELTALDANLRFAKAELLIQLRMPRRAQAVIDGIEQRFQGREDMLVDFPFGESRSLGEGLEMLRERKWRS